MQFCLKTKVCAIKIYIYVCGQAAPSAELQGGQQQDVEEDDVLFSIDLEARKAGLRAQLAVFAKVHSYACA